MPEVLPKIRRLRDHATRKRTRPLTIMVDGGIGIETASECAAHGANAFVAGTFLFTAADMAGEVVRMREAAQRSYRM
jgi:ribulose-phosphate 3-epimerase